MAADHNRDDRPDVGAPGATTRSRRAVLVAAASGVGALVAEAIADAPKAAAANGGNFILGQANSATAQTTLSASGLDNLQHAFGVSTTQGHAVHAETTDTTAGAAIQCAGPRGGLTGTTATGPYPGVAGQGDPGVRGSGNTGVAGFGGLAIPSATPSGTGTYGESGSEIGAVGITAGAASTVAGHSGTGVFGASGTDLGTGVWGLGASSDTSNSTGVLGEGDTGVFGAGTFGNVGGAFADGIGVYGSASNSAIPSVFGATGVIGQSDAGGTGVVGFTGLTEPVPPGDVGVYGRADVGGASARGVKGESTGGIGVMGQTTSGVAIRAYCPNTTGVGLRVTGKAAFDRSGKIVVTAGHSNVVKTSIALTSSSFVLATLQTNVAGLYIQSVVTTPSGSKFTIYLNKAPSVNVSVAWMVVN
jgi:hypothetical protein